jgi:hypothetical protein
LLDKSDDAGSVLLPLGIPIPSLSRVTKEGGVAHVAHLLPMPVSGIPREVGNETGLKDLVNWGFFTWWEYVFGQFERCSMAFLGKDPDRCVPLKGDDSVMQAGSLDSASVG